MAAWKLAPALATGNTCVLKPAETTPLSALLLAEILQQAELPPGVVNILTGAGDTGAALVAHPGLDKVAFTGSTEVGKQIQRSLAGTGKRLTLELGGKAANIVFDDAPLSQAVEGIVNGIFFNQGQVCCAGSRLLVQEPIAEGVVEALKRRLETLRLGDPLDKNTDIGAINSSQQLDKIRQLAASGEDEGAQRWSPACALPERGYWFPPTLFTGVVPAQRIAREEIFGPVLSVLTFRTPEEAIEKANNTTYGLSAGVWTEKGSRILHMAARLRAGVVWANTFNRFDPSSPFGGYRESGFGREGGRHGLAAYLEGAFGERPCLRARRPRAGAAGRLAVRKTYKLYVGGAFPRSESGRSYLVCSPGRPAPGQRRPRLPQGPPRRRRGGAQGPAGLGRGHRLPAGPGALPGGRDARRPPRPVRRGARGGGRSDRRGRRRRGGRRRRPPGLVRRAGRTSSLRWRGRPTRWPALTSISPFPSPPAWSGCSLPRRLRSWAW